METKTKEVVYIYVDNKKIAVKTIDIKALEWFDRVNGNSYFAGEITVNFGLKTEKSFNMPFQYGYGDHYKDMALNLLKEYKLIGVNRLWELRDKGVILRTNKVENCLKRDLKQYC